MQNNPSGEIDILQLAVNGVNTLKKHKILLAIFICLGLLLSIIDINIHPKRYSHSYIKTIPLYTYIPTKEVLSEELGAICLKIESIKKSKQNIQTLANDFQTTPDILKQLRNVDFTISEKSSPSVANPWENLYLLGTLTIEADSIYTGDTLITKIEKYISLTPFIKQQLISKYKQDSIMLTIIRKQIIEIDSLKYIFDNNMKQINSTSLSSYNERIDLLLSYNRKLDNTDYLDLYAQKEQIENRKRNYDSAIKTTINNYPVDIKSNKKNYVLMPLLFVFISLLTGIVFVFSLTIISDLRNKII